MFQELGMAEPSEGARGTDPMRVVDGAAAVDG